MENKEILEVKAQECINDIKGVMAKHGLKGKVRLILALCAVNYISEYPNHLSGYDSFANCEERKPLLSLIPTYFEKETWYEIADCFASGFYREDGKFNGYNPVDICETALLLVKKPKDKDKLKLVDEVIDAMRNNPLV